MSKQVSTLQSIENRAPHASAVHRDIEQVPTVECRGLWKVYGDERRAAQIVAGIQSKSIELNADRQYSGCFVAVQDVNISLRCGETFCVMGLSGSGKSTLIRHINGLIKPTAGDVLIEGQSTAAMSNSSLRHLRSRKIGMVFQLSSLLPHRTAGENVTLSLELRGESRKAQMCVREKMLDLVGLSGWGDHDCNELSGGMQQRVGLARALAGDPDILLMDEPFSALDPLIRGQLQCEFKRLSKSIGKTTVFITHDLDEAIRLGDRIAIMKEGRIVQLGTPEQIVAAPVDNYVRRFTEGISRIHLLTARTIMKPLDGRSKINATDNAPFEALPRALADDSINTLLGLYLDHESSIAVEENGSLVGLIGVQELLGALRDTGDVSGN